MALEVAGSSPVAHPGRIALKSLESCGILVLYTRGVGSKFSADRFLTTSVLGYWVCAFGLLAGIASRRFQEVESEAIPDAQIVVALWATTY